MVVRAVPTTARALRQRGSLRLNGRPVFYPRQFACVLQNATLRR